MRVGADLLVRIADQGVERRLLQALVLDPHLDGEAEAAAVARSDRDRTGDGRLRRILLLLLGDEIERAAETGGVAGGEEMLGRGGAGLARTAHRLRHRQIGLDRPVAGLAMAIATTQGGRGRGEERLDLVHVVTDPNGRRPIILGSAWPGVTRAAQPPPLPPRP